MPHDGPLARSSSEPMIGPPGPLLKLVRDQRLAFLVIGGVNTVLSYGFFVGFEILLGDRTGYIVALVLTHLASVPCAFLLYRWFVFRVRGNFLRDLGRFELVYLSAFLMNLAVLPILVEWANLPVIAAQTIVVLISVGVTFFGHKHFSFRRQGMAIK